ncbi:TonB-dependent receptor [Asticcacaulis tiandongensis]|uniref:TonB-dependent receptor n=1 Tax=Asticcacaulis tiandongensis TaxID=2565365 RepID=UPI0015E874EB|nr:TonB-dependent receptor [Asticcacaulis tiandongensis]
MLLASPATAQNTRQRFDIEAQSLDQALDAFAALAQTPVLFDRALVNKRNSTAVRGHFTDKDAVARLLRGTGLTYRITQGGVILIVPEPEPKTTKAAPATAVAAHPDERDEYEEYIEPVTEVVVTGFRTSLGQALSLKRHSEANIDAIFAEDVAKFPNTNLAGAMQRIPSVTLIIGDGGEGRNITVRGLGPMFSRVRINGMEAASQTGASDKFGPNNNSRSFDFNVFSSDIFSALIVTKSAVSDVEEGSLGATVDLHVPKPFDFEADRVISVSTRTSRNTISQLRDGRASVLVSQKFGGGRFGLLATASHQNGHTREVGYSAADILSAGLSGNGTGTGAEVQPFCTPMGYPVISPNPALFVPKGTSELFCSTGNPRTGSLSAYKTIMDLRSPIAPHVPASGAFFPRLPRYLNSTQREIRTAGTFSFQYRPDMDTDIGFDVIYTRYDNLRQDNYIEAISFARSATANGQPMMSVKDIRFTSDGSLLYGLFDGVDIRSEGLTDKFSTTFTQSNLSFRRRFTPTLEVTGFLGASDTVYDNPKRLQLFMDAIDTVDFAIDFHGNNRGVPHLSFGPLDVNDIGSFHYQPPLTDGTVLGGFSTQSKPLTTTLVNRTLAADAKWTPWTSFSIKAGYEHRTEAYSSRYFSLIPAQTPVLSKLDLSHMAMGISGLDKLWGHGAPSRWVAIDPEKWAQAVDWNSFKYCSLECGTSDNDIRETTSAVYAMLMFDTKSVAPVPIRGNIGIRYFHTDQLTIGYIPVTAPEGSVHPLTSERVVAERSYQDLLPSANIVFDISDTALVRVSAAKVISRPDLYTLTPNAVVNAIPRIATVNNPYLKPIQATTFDLSLEWYFSATSLFSAGVFHKNISSYIQRINSQATFESLGLPTSLLNNSNSLPTDIFTVSQLANTSGGPLTGLELNLQADLDFLPGFWRHFGVLANYTRTQSRINYILSSENSLASTSVTADLIGLSRHSSSATIYYENKTFSARLMGTYKSGYIRRIPSGPGSDIQGNAPTFFLDASASYDLTPGVRIFFEAQNLTDEHNRQYIDSVRQDTVYDTRSGRTVSFGLTMRY